MKFLSHLLITAATICVGMTPVCTFADDGDFRIKYAEAVRNAAKRVLPSIVTVEIIGAVGENAGEVEQDAPTSGIVVDKSGLVLASSIVVRRPSATMLVVLPDGSRHPAKVVSKDNHRDLVLLKIKTDKELSVAELPDEFDLPVGSTMVSVGRYGVDSAPLVSAGVLSAVERLDGIALQTDARVSPSFYGGAMIDLRGNLVGVLIPAVLPGGAPDATSWYDSGIAFAIPTNVIKQKLDRLRKGDDIDKGLIGIVPKAKDPYKNDTELAAVRNRSPAEIAGLKPGDVILSVGGRKVRRFQEIRQALGSYDAGEKLMVGFRRDGKSDQVEVELAKEIPPLQPQRLGIIAQEITESDEANEEDEAPEAKDDDDSDKAEADEKDDDADEEKDDDEDSEPEIQVIVQATQPGSAADGELKANDVISKVAGVEITSIESLRSQLISAQPGEAISIMVLRDNTETEVSIKPKSVAGELNSKLPADWGPDSEIEWKTEDLKLPDVGNKIAVHAPPADSDTEQLGMLVVLLNPGQDDPKKALSGWTDAAKKAGVVLCAIAPEADERWKPKEMETIGRIASAVVKKFPIEPTAVAIGTEGALKDGKAEASDAMALGVAISESKTFFGVAISNEARPPAIRLKENDPSAPLQLLVPIAGQEDYPKWATALEKAGYPIVMGGELNQTDLLSWVRLLQAI